ncbi:MAG TPA: YcxB family protein [Woeseiaceae bacterium]|nr:YcxB family protein [Woeseiaceae bacterium]
MQVELHVTRGDITKFNLSKLFRLRSHLQLIAIILVGVAFFAWRKAERLGEEIDWILVVVSSAGGFAAIFVFSLVFILLNSNTKSGVLGKHTYTIEDVGFREQTAANDTLNYWPAIQKIDKTKFAITVQINAWLFHILPRRAFDGQEQFEAFYEALCRRVVEENKQG